MTGLEMKYLTSACLDLTGNAYWYLQGVTGELGKPKALHLMPPDKVHAVIDRRTWPYQVIGYKMKLETTEMAFKPEEVIQFRLPNPANFFEGYSPVQAGAEFIDNDTYAMEFNRKFFINGARPAGFLESDLVGETQIDALKMGFVDLHAGIDNMNRIGVLPKGVKWSPYGATRRTWTLRTCPRTCATAFWPCSASPAPFWAPQNRTRIERRQKRQTMSSQNES